MLKDNVVYLREFLREFRDTGTAFPSSAIAAKALTKPLAKRNSAQRILELGPGTGSVTVQILRHMLPGDQLTICEINPRFMRALRKNLETNRDFVQHQAQVSFFLGPVQQLPEDGPYDCIVCAIPFLNLDLSTVREIFAKLERISKPTTVLTYYEYIGLRSLGIIVSPPERKKRLQELDGFFKTVHQTHRTSHERIWFNLLPIHVHTVQVHSPH